MTRILVVDDEPAMRKLVRRILDKAGMEVVETDGEEALLVFLAQEFDLVLLDLFMPGRDGIELLREFRREWSTVKIVAMSGGGLRGTVDLLTVARALGAKETIRKPFTPAELLAAVNRVLA